MKILVSKCLTGCSCRYDGTSCPNEKVLALYNNDNTIIAVCPEQDGGLSTPRSPGERVGDKIMSKEGNDVTKEYLKGANVALEIAKREKVDLCVMKSKSPSCGKGVIYDGTFSGKKVSGNGVTVDLLLESGFKVITEEEL